MLNQSADYALRAVLYVARQAPKRAHSAAGIARALGLPQNYLGKLLNTLAHVGVLSSTRGPRGGFRLAEDPEVLTVADVTAPFQIIASRGVCLLGDRPCNPLQPCAAHSHWQTMSDHVTAFFRTTTIAQMLRDNAPVKDPLTFEGVRHERNSEPPAAA